MQKLGLFFLFFIPIISCSQKSEQTSYIQEIRKHRYEINIAFADKKTTVLAKKDFKKFSSLEFFPIDTNYRIEAKFIRTPDEIPFQMATTTSRKSIALKYGEAHFILNNKNLVLSIYQTEGIGDDYVNYLFLPFNDQTNGNESYGGGRYIDLRPPKGNSIVIDFNKAYNPFCAYNDTYSCAIPPKENHLDVAINAGVKAFKH